MLATAVIVFREVLEAALIIGLIMAVTRGVPGRRRLMLIGMGAGIAGALLVALLTDLISPLAKGMGTELLNAMMLSAAVVMLTWHLVWMHRHSKTLTHQIRQMGNRIIEGEKAPVFIAVIIGIALLREGSEVVLLMYGVAAAGSNSASMLTGGFLGLLAGAVIGVVMYFGLTRIPISKLFRVSGWILMLLTAGLAAQASSFLVQADVLPALGYGIWDTSAILSETSILGQLLHILVGYISQPMGIQILVYSATLITIILLNSLIGNLPDQGAKTA